MRAGKRIGFILSSILIAVIIYLVGMVLISNIKTVEAFYSKNQFVFWLGGLLLVKNFFCCRFLMKSA